MSDKKTTFKSFKDFLGEDRHALFDKDATVLRWVGFSAYKSVCEAQFEDAEGNAWTCDFKSVGDQELTWGEDDIARDLDDDPTLAKEAATMFELAEVDIDEWMDDGVERNEAMAQAFDHYLGEAEGETLYLDHLPIVKFALANELASWVRNSWLQPRYEVKNPEGTVILADYASNMIVGEGVYDSVAEIKRSYEDESYLAKIAETFGTFMKHPEDA